MNGHDAAHDGFGLLSQDRGGRILCLLFAVYGFAIFGYITAAVASLLVGEDRKDDEREPPKATNDDVHAQLVGVRKQLADLQTLFEEHFRRPPSGPS